MNEPSREHVLARVRSALVAAYGSEPQEASITFLGTPAMTVLRFVDTGTRMVRYVSLGCSGEPMGDPAELVPDPAAPRAELCVSLLGGVDGIARALAVLASTPAVEGLRLTPGALVDLGEPLWPGATFTAVLLRPSALPEIELGGPAAPVQVLEAVPVTQTEAAWVRVRGAEALEEAWREAGVDVTDPGRPAAQPR